jgi:hypothetical protein
MSIFDVIGDGFEVLGKGVVDGLATVGEGTIIAGKFVGGMVTGDSYYPDNAARESRAKELAADVSQCSYRIAADTLVVKDGLADLTETIEKIYKNIGSTPPDIAVAETVNFHETAYTISKVVAPLVVVGAINMALVDGSVVAEAAAGELTVEAAGAELGAATLGMGPAAAIMAGVLFTVGAIEGDDRRSKLRDMTHDNYRLRTRLTKSEVLLTKLGHALTGLSSSIKTGAQSGLTSDQLTQMLHNKIAGVVEGLKVDVSGSVATQLASKDTSRGSWTNEDT